MCGYCLVTLGTLVGGAVIVKVGGLAGIKATTGTAVAKLLTFLK
jgi:hypothetical protein